MCRGFTEIFLTFWARHTRMLSTTVASSHQSLLWLSLSSCILVEILIFSCFICHWNISSSLTSPFLFPAAFCAKNPWIASFFLSTFSVGFFPCLRGDPLPSNAWTVALCLKICQELSSLGHPSVSPLFAWEGCRGCLWQCSCSDSNVKRTALPLLKLCLFYSLMTQPGYGGILKVI